jgi:hypothetical protein
MAIILQLRSKGKPVLRGRDHFWSVIMARHREGKTFTLRDVDGQSNGDTGNPRQFIRLLQLAGLIEKTGAGSTMWDTEYRPLVIQSAAPRIRKNGSVIESLPAIQCMWNLMRGPLGRSGFTWLDLVHWSQTDETKISPRTARSYVATLLAASYLIVINGAKPGSARQKAVYRLDPKMNTGPNAPKILQTKLVFDPNRLEVMGSAHAEEVQP